MYWIRTYLWPSRNPESALQFYKSDVFFSNFPEWKEIMSHYLYEDLVYDYVKKYCDDDLWSLFEISPFFHAIKLRDAESIEFIKLVIDHQSINLNEVDQEEGNTIFHYIINDFEMMKLFTKRLRINSEALKIRNNDLETPIDKLDFEKSEEFFAKFPEWREILLDLSQDYDNFCLVLKYIMSYWYGDDDVNHNSPIFHAVHQVYVSKPSKHELKKHTTRSIEVIKLIAHHKLINLYETDQSKQTIFHIICESQINKKAVPVAWEFFRERLEEDPKLLNVQDCWKKTPITCLIDVQGLKTLKTILDNEHLVEVFDFQNINGQTYLHQTRNEEVAILLSTKMDVNVQDNKGRTALHYACIYNRYETSVFLIEKPNIDINATDEDGKTALHHACQTSESRIIRLFLTYHEERDINLSILDNEGKNPLSILLEREKANPNAKLNEVILGMITSAARCIRYTVGPDKEDKDDSQDLWSNLEYLDLGTNDEFSVSDKSDVD